MKASAVGLIGTMALALGTVSTQAQPSKLANPVERFVIAQRGGSCKAASTCREAVEMWCGGYRRADADGDGIPCENVCRSLNQVEAIKKDIGC